MNVWPQSSSRRALKVKQVRERSGEEGWDATIDMVAREGHSYRKHLCRDPDEVLGSHEGSSRPGGEKTHGSSSAFRAPGASGTGG